MFPNRERGKWWVEEHRERLIARVCGFAGQAREIWIAFDGDREAEPDARKLRTSASVPVYLVFAPSADDWLVKRVRSYRETQLAELAELAESSGSAGSASSPGMAVAVAVVTRDRRVAGRARHAGAEVVTPAGFLDLCAEA
jgi:hypothetical protein